MRKELEKYFDRLWPICRSITGQGLRESFKILQEIIPFELTEVPTGTKVFDWEIPQEWNISNAYILTPTGEKIADFKTNNLHIVNYSEPINSTMGWDELRPHLHTLPNMPNAVPYITSYYKRTWGFCISQEQYDNLPKSGDYTVVIESEIKDGSLTYGEAILKGETDEEILISSYLCHPSMANNELSGPLAQAFLYRQLKSLPNRKYTYRFVLAPETIGIIAFLAKKDAQLKQKVKYGYVLTCCGDPGRISYQRSKEINHEVNQMVEHLLAHQFEDYLLRDFMVGGSDERQYNSPGFKMPVGTLMRTPYKLFKEYHTSLDNKDFVSFEALEEFILFVQSVCEGHEINERYLGAVQECEPMLGKRGLYASEGAWMKKQDFVMNMLYFLSYADGETSLLEIAKRKNTSLMEFKDVVKVTRNNDLIK